MNDIISGVINTGMLLPMYDIVWKIVAAEPMYKAKAILDNDRGVGTTIYLNGALLYRNGIEVSHALTIKFYHSQINPSINDYNLWQAIITILWAKL